MANEAKIQFLTDKITGLNAIQQELTQRSARITDLDLADRVRAQLSSLNETLFALESARNSLVASLNVVPPPGDDQVQALREALRQIDALVRSDQTVHAALNGFLQIAELIKRA